MQLDNLIIAAENANLAALHYKPVTLSHPTALLFAHGFTSGKYSLDLLASYLAMKGYEGLTFDFVGHKMGATGGEMHHVRQAVENLQAALDWLRQNTRAEEIMLVGHSMGAAASIAVAAHEQQHPPDARAARIAGVISICMGLEPSRGFMGAIGRSMLAQRSDYVAGAPAVQLLTEIESLVPLARHLGDLPSLFIAARQDVLISVERVEGLAQLAGVSAQVAIIEASHLEAPDRSRATISHWLEKNRG